ncbi:hypothetical protein BLA9940_07047 [Burkholderia aenigmatica]|uniref:hypothetical protein n=1 Tax=Burkholderia aenigmatica TaxID=2015348 RepID=UPI00145434F3|nr:hypothetical protein [Burkholderia aenigmatica]VWD14349.1 hypothetical protein BLA9940_07047 [Burkholderia aenigmatica]
MTPVRYVVIALSAVGAAVVAAMILDGLGVGHVRIYFGTDPLVCTVPTETSRGATL